MPTLDPEWQLTAISSLLFFVLIGLWLRRFIEAADGRRRARERATHR